MSEALLTGWRFRMLTLSILAAAGGYLAFSLWVGWHDVLLALKQVGILGLMVAITMSLINYGLRIVRWQLYFNALGHNLPWRSQGRIYLAGFALTTTPGKAGEAIRGVFLKHWSVPYSHSFAVFLSERLSDLTAIVLLALFGLSLYPKANTLILFGVLVVIGILVILSQEKLLRHLYLSTEVKIRRLFRWLRHILQMLLEARRCHSMGVLIPASVLSILAWGAEALAFYWLLDWLEADISLTFAVFVYAMSMLAGAVSFMPGGLGGTEAVMVVLLVWKGLPAAEATAATVLIRLTTLWFAVALGFIALATFRNHGEVSA